MNSGDLLWLLVIFAVVQPLLKQRMLEYAREKFFRGMETRRGSRLIAIVHREEGMSILGFPAFRYIDIEDSETVLRAIRLTEPEVPIDIILHTPGGVVLAVEQIVHALRRHKGKVTAFVPHYAMSGGALIALAADELVMTENSVLGAVDPQVGQYPAASILKTLEIKPLDKIEDKTLVLAEQARKSIQQTRDLVQEVLASRMDESDAARIAEAMTAGTWTLDYPISVEELSALGISVCTEMPTEVFQLMNLYPQIGHGRPSVDFIPLPYRTPELPAGSNK